MSGAVPHTLIASTSTAICRRASGMATNSSPAKSSTPVRSVWRCSAELTCRRVSCSAMGLSMKGDLWSKVSTELLGKLCLCDFVLEGVYRTFTATSTTLRLPQVSRLLCFFAIIFWNRERNRRNFAASFSPAMLHSSPLLRPAATRVQRPNYEPVPARHYNPLSSIY